LDVSPAITRVRSISLKFENLLTKTLRHVDVSAAQGEKRASINEMFLIA